MANENYPQPPAYSVSPVSNWTFSTGVRLLSVAFLAEVLGSRLSHLFLHGQQAFFFVALIALWVLYAFEDHDSRIVRIAMEAMKEFLVVLAAFYAKILLEDGPNGAPFQVKIVTWIARQANEGPLWYISSLVIVVAFSIWWSAGAQEKTKEYKEYRKRRMEYERLRMER